MARSSEHHESEIEVLRQKGDVDGLSIQLQSPAFALRLEALSALATLDDPRATAAITDTYTDDRAHLVRVGAAAILAKRGDAAATQALVDALTDSEPDVRMRAAAALARQGDERGTDALAHTLKSDDFDERNEAIALLVEVGDPRGAKAQEEARVHTQDEVKREHRGRIMMGVGLALFLGSLLVWAITYFRGASTDGSLPSNYLPAGVLIIGVVVFVMGFFRGSK